MVQNRPELLSAVVPDLKFNGGSNARHSDIVILPELLFDDAQQGSKGVNVGPVNCDVGTLSNRHFPGHDCCLE